MPPDYVPPSDLAEQLLRSFRPHRTGMIKPEGWAEHLDVSVEEVNRCLAEFLAAGLVEPSRALRPASPQQRYQATPTAWRARESFLRSQGLRHSTLVGQEAFQPKDLIIAILADAHHGNARIANGMGYATGESWDFVTFYLDQFGEEELRLARDSLMDEKLVIPGSPGRIDLSKRAWRRYQADVAPRLHLEPGMSILDDVLEKSIDVFLSWQSEFPSSRSLIKDLLTRSFDKINKTKRPTRPLELIQATSVGDGAVRIDVQLLTRIKNAHLFVADVTAVSEDNGRHRVNDNVLVEVGYALASKDPGQILLLAQKRDLPPGRMPFDIGNVQRFDLLPEGRKDGRVQAEIETMLQKRGWLIG